MENRHTGWQTSWRCQSICTEADTNENEGNGKNQEVCISMIKDDAETTAFPCASEVLP